MYLEGVARLQQLTSGYLIVDDSLPSWPSVCAISSASVRLQAANPLRSRICEAPAMPLRVPVLASEMYLSLFRYRFQQSRFHPLTCGGGAPQFAHSRRCHHDQDEHRSDDKCEADRPGDEHGGISARDLQ